jgi:hypothetical protein
MPGIYWRNPRTTQGFDRPETAVLEISDRKHSRGSGGKHLAATDRRTVLHGGSSVLDLDRLECGLCGVPSNRSPNSNPKPG